MACSVATIHTVTYSMLISATATTAKIKSMMGNSNNGEQQQQLQQQLYIFITWQTIKLFTYFADNGINKLQNKN